MCEYIKKWTTSRNNLSCITLVDKYGFKHRIIAGCKIEKLQYHIVQQIILIKTESQPNW